MVLLWIVKKIGDFSQKEPCQQAVSKTGIFPLENSNSDIYCIGFSQIEMGCVLQQNGKI
jgi:hypothetical protein